MTCGISYNNKLALSLFLLWSPFLYCYWELTHKPSSKDYFFCGLCLARHRHTTWRVTAISWGVAFGLFRLFFSRSSTLCLSISGQGDGGGDRTDKRANSGGWTGGSEPWGAGRAGGWFRWWRHAPEIQVMEGGRSIDAQGHGDETMGVVYFALEWREEKALTCFYEVPVHRVVHCVASFVCLFLV